MSSNALGIPLQKAAELGELVEAHRAEAVEAATEAIYQRLGASLADFGHQGKERCREDLHYHLDYLTGSLLAGEPQPFKEYLAWLHELLEARSVPTESLNLSLEYLEAFFQERLSEDAFEPLQAVLGAGQKTLREGNQYPGPFQPYPDSQLQHPSLASLVDNLIRGDRQRSLEIARSVAQKEGYLGMALGLIQPAMYWIGQKWQAREISVAQEHLATALVNQILVRQFAETPALPPDGRKTLFACVAFNHHSLGLRIVADAFELEGWAVEFLGADTPTADLIAQIRQSEPQLVGLSVALVRQLRTLKEAIERIHTEFGTKAPAIIAGGAGLSNLPNLAERLGLEGLYPQAQAALETWS